MTIEVRWRMAGATLFFMTALAGDGSDPGVRVATRHLGFVKLATDAGVRITPDLDAVGGEIEEHLCKLTATARTMLPPQRSHLAEAYATDYCRPWLRLWDRVLDSCDSDRPPIWCDDEARVLEKLDLNGYFSTLTAAMRGSASTLERDNILDTALTAFAAHAIRDFGNEPPDRWATDVTGAYLQSAEPTEAIVLARRLQATWVGLTPGVVGAFHDYSRRVEMSAEDHGELDALLAKRFSP